MAKLFEWKCPKCNKEISSTHKGQFEYNKKLHIDSHKKESINDKIPTKKVDEEGRVR